MLENYIEKCLNCYYFFYSLEKINISTEKEKKTMVGRMPHSETPFAAVPRHHTVSFLIVSVII